MTEVNDLMPCILDRQISTADRDAFGHRHYAHALRSLIESERHQPPFSIGLLGGWGTGKSTIKELYVQDLRDDARNAQSGRRRSDRIHCITFNAWRFGGREQDVKRALLRHVFLELGGDEEDLHDRLFRQITESQEVSQDWKQYTRELLKACAMPLPALLLSLVPLVVLLLLVVWLIPIEGGIPQSLVLVAFTGAYSYLLKHVRSAAPGGARSVNRITLPITTAEQYEDLLLDQIRKFKAGSSSAPDRSNGGKCERLVVFVDDLDRLSADEMVLGLDAVRTFMEIPEGRLPKGLGLVFVISCDEARVADALAKGRRQGELPGTVFTQGDARRYLDRIFQFRLEIPPFPRQDMRQYAIRQLNELPGMAADLQSRGTTVEAVVDRMIHVGVHDPRNALQIVNAFAQAWWLAKKRETEEIGTDRPGGLHEGAVTAHPISLGALSAIRVNFPDFYRDLQNDPSLLHRATDVIVRRRPLDEQPLPTQQLLIERYLLPREAGQAPSTDVRSEHRQLRQLLASLVGLRWPGSLQSLLLLSEDPITRKFGAKATTIYDAFVSGDKQGVLEGLGRHTDQSPLRPEEARLLHQMSEELRHESAARRTAASRVIAELVDRLPAETARMLVGSLCRELVDSADLRSQLGVEKMAKVLAAATSTDRTAVASRLVEDVLTVDEDIRLRLESMQPPDLDEAIAFARAVVPVALAVRRDNGLDSMADRQLLDWLVDRTVRVGGKQYQIPFREFDGWMNDDEDHLLPSLGRQYTDLVADELESGTLPETDAKEVLRRVQKVFATLWTAGEDARRGLWVDLQRYVGFRQQEASMAACEAMVKHVSSPNPTELSGFTVALIDRLKKEAEDDQWPLDLGAASQALLTVVRTRLDDLDGTSMKNLADLAILWGYGETASLSCDVLNEVRRADSTESQRVFSDWATRLLTDLPNECIHVLARDYPTLTAEVQSQVGSSLQLIVSTDNIDEAASGRYQAFARDVPKESWVSGPLKSHLDVLLPYLSARHNNPHDYLRRVFPVAAQLLQRATPSVAGPAVHELFAQAKGQPNHYAWLHGCMVGHWPANSKQLRPYDSTQIFNDGVEFARNRPQSSSDGLLKSLGDMVTRGIVPAEHRRGLVEAACATWSASPNQAIDTLLGGFNDLTSEETANLITGIDWSNDDHQMLLSQAWESVAMVQSGDDRFLTTKRILERGPTGPSDDPDRALRLWIEAHSAHRRELLSDALNHAELGDQSKRRLWQQATRQVNILGAEFFLAIVPVVVGLPSAPETAAAVFDDFELVSATLASTTNRADLSQRLMRVFPNAATNTVKGLILESCKKLNGDASLSELEPENLSSDDITLVESKFGGSAAMKRIQARTKAQ